MDINYPNFNNELSLCEFWNNFGASEILDFEDLNLNTFSTEDQGFLESLDFDENSFLDTMTQISQIQVNELSNEPNVRPSSVADIESEESIYDSGISSCNEDNESCYLLPTTCLNFGLDKSNKSQEQSQKESIKVAQQHHNRRKGRPQKDLTDLEEKLEVVEDYKNRRIIKNNIASRKYRHKISEKRSKINKITDKLIAKKKKLEAKYQKLSTEILELEKYLLRS